MSDADFYKARAHYNRGQTLLGLDRTQEAKSEFEEVKRLVHDYPGIDEALRSLDK